MPNEIKTWPYKTGYARTKLIHSQGATCWAINFMRLAGTVH
jgi:hypothetical protein